MEFKGTQIKDLYLIKNFHSIDERGEFTKLFNDSEFKKHGIDFRLKELFYTTSKKDTIRAMHFNVPPVTQAKIIHCISGSILDVVLDLRKNSSSFMKIEEFYLSENDKKALYIPVGCAHGYKSLNNNTKVIYLSNCEFSKECDSGIKYNSFGYDWKIDKPILSEKDKNLINLREFKNPF